MFNCFELQSFGENSPSAISDFLGRGDDTTCSMEGTESLTFKDSGWFKVKTPASRQSRLHITFGAKTFLVQYRFDEGQMLF